MQQHRRPLGRSPPSNPASPPSSNAPPLPSSFKRWLVVRLLLLGAVGLLVVGKDLVQFGGGGEGGCIGEWSNSGRGATGESRGALLRGGGGGSDGDDAGRSRIEASEGVEERVGKRKGPPKNAKRASVETSPKKIGSGMEGDKNPREDGGRLTGTAAASIAKGDGDDTNAGKKEKAGIGSSNSNSNSNKTIIKKRVIKRYTLESALKVFEVYDRFVALFLYDPASDEFYTVYDPDISRWDDKYRFPRIRDAMFESLRIMFPERLRKESGNGREFAVVVASGDYPQMFYRKKDGGTGCFAERIPRPQNGPYCVPGDLPPILQFGSVFDDSTKMPSIIAMPMPAENHLGCFQHFAREKEKKSRGVCELLQERRFPGNPTGLVFPETVKMGWDDLIPQVVWRAADRGFLTTMLMGLRRPDFERDVSPRLEEERKKNTENKKKDKNGSFDNGNGEENANITATKAMRDVYDDLRPRWKGVVWTAEAEREAEAKARRQQSRIGGDDEVILPWCNIKFATTMYANKRDDAKYYEEFMKVGIPAVGGRMDLETLAKYKYHVDIGGGGGTTWSGTLEKLAMTGLLFHHMTPTRDYIHDLLEPWMHYVPLKEDLSDLRERYDWAESHPEEARAISERATGLIRQLGTEEGFDEAYRNFYEAPLGKVVGAYEPLPDGESWRETIRRFRGKNNGRDLHLRPVARCGGYGGKDDCSEIDGGKGGLRMQDR